MSGTKPFYLPSSVKTGGVALPSGVASEIEREQRQMVEEMDSLSGALEYWSRELQTIFNDPHVKVILAKPTTTVVGLKPNYYHIVRVRPGTAAWIQPIETPDGGWKELDSSVVDIAMKSDLWNDRTQRELARQRERAQEAAKREKERQAMARAGDFDERLKAALTTSISVSRSIK